MKKSTFNVTLHYLDSSTKSFNNIIVYLIKEETNNLIPLKLIKSGAALIKPKLKDAYIVLVRSVLNTDLLIKKAFYHELGHYLYNKDMRSILRFDSKTNMWFNVNEMVAQSMEHAESFINAYSSLFFETVQEKEKALILSELHKAYIDYFKDCSNAIIPYGRRKMYDY